MLHILIDTSILHQEGFESRQMKLLTRLVDADKALVYVPEIIKREFISKKNLDTTEAIHDINKKIEKIRRAKYFDVDHDNKLTEFSLYLKNLSAELGQLFEEAFSNWLLKINGVLISFDPFILENVIDDYFNGLGAFRRPKSRDDFPDAFIFYAIKSVLEDCDLLYVVVRDGSFKQCLESLDTIITAKGLKELFSLPEFTRPIKELDEESERIQKIMSFLETDNCKEYLEIYLLSDRSEIGGIYLFGEDILNAEHTLGMKIWGAEIEEIFHEDLSEVNFDKIDYLGDEAYSIGCSFKSYAKLRYAAKIDEYIGLHD